jgi:hypothetical protein
MLAYNLTSAFFISLCSFLPVSVVADLNPRTEDKDLIVSTTAPMLLAKSALMDFLFLVMMI